MTTLSDTRGLGMGAVPTSWADRRPQVRLFAFTLLLALVANAVNLFLYPFSIDAEVNTFNPDPVGFVGSGRWAAFVLSKYLLPNAAVPVVPLLIACCTLSLAYVVTTSTWDERIGWPHYLAAPIAVCHPLLFQLFSFSVISYAVGLGTLFCALGVRLLDRPSPVRFAASVPLFTFAFGIYQPIALYPCMAFAVGTGIGLATGRGLRATLRLALVFGAALVLAVLANRALTDLGYRLAQVTHLYMDEYFDLPYLKAHPLRALRDTLLFAVPIVSGLGRGPFISDCWPYAATMALSAVLALASFALRRQGIFRALAAAGLVFGAVLVSILPSVLNDGVLPWRVFLGTPIALAGVVFCAGQVGLRPARTLLGVLVALSFFACAQIGARLYYSNYLVWLDDRALGEAILTRVDALDDLPARGPITIEFAGFHDWPKSDQIIDIGADSTMGTSFFAWDGGNPDRIVEFLKTLGRFDFAVVSPEKRAAIRPIVDAMPAWPRAGSVRMVDGVLVIRFSPYSSTQEERLFPGATKP